MKKLMYVLIVFLVNGSISAQRTPEELVPLSDPAKATAYTEETVYIRHTCCFCGTRSINTPLDAVVAIIGGIPGEYGDAMIIVNKPFYNGSEIEQNISTKNEVPLVTISKQENIKRIPSTMGETDLVCVLKVMGCPGTVDDEIGEAVDQKSTPGPNTGLEGHNFIEDPAIIYPNPVKDILQIKSTDPITVIEILNLHGQVEKVMNINEQMIVSDLAAGIYYARISFENRKKVQVEKILIVK